MGKQPQQISHPATLVPSGSDAEQMRKLGWWWDWGRTN